MSDRQCKECLKQVPQDEAIMLCDAADAKEQYCGDCFAAWGCEEKHGEGCATVVWEAPEPALQAEKEHGLTIDDCRAEVKAFAVLMERELRANEHKPGWKRDNPRALAHRVVQEAKELLDEANRFPAGGAGKMDALDAAARIAEEAADVGNMAMMVADVCGALPQAGPSGSGERITLTCFIHEPMLRRYAAGDDTADLPNLYHRQEHDLISPARITVEMLPREKTQPQSTERSMRAGREAISNGPARPNTDGGGA